MRARSVEAGVLYYRREYQAAAAIFDELRAFAESKNDVVEVARQSCNAAACWIELGDGALAERLLSSAKETYRSLGLQTEVAAAEWKLGVAARVSGRFDESVDRLRAAKHVCERLAMPAESANASLDLIESLLLVGERREIASLARGGLLRRRFAAACRKADFLRPIRQCHTLASRVRARHRGHCPRAGGTLSAAHIKHSLYEVPA